MNAVNRRFLAISVRTAPAIVALTLLLATVAKAAIVEISGSAVPNTLNSSLAGHSAANPFYTEKISAAGSYCAGT